MASFQAPPARTFHLAQINVGRMRAPLGDPLMAGFASRLDAINALADLSPGFVWRLKDESRTAAIVAFGDPLVLANMSVWESLESLKAYTYRGDHADVLRGRRQWFEPMATPHLALWWAPAGHRPDLGEARERLEYLGRHGSSDAAFTFRDSFAAPEIEEAGEVTPPLLYDGRVFETRANTVNGETGAGTVFRYRQNGAHVWATYEGGGIRIGRLAARCDRGGVLNMRYQHLSPSGVFRAGRCRAVPERLTDGRLRLHEDWQWDGGERGRSVLEEPVG